MRPTLPRRPPEPPGALPGRRSHPIAQTVLPAVLAPFLVVLPPAAGTAGGQVLTAPTPVGQPVRTDLGLDVLDALDARMAGGDVDGAVQVARRIVAAAHRAGLPPDVCDLRHAYVALVWAAADGAGRTVLRRIHLPPLQGRPHALDLPGAGTPASRVPLYEMLVAGDPRARLDSVYASTREADPVAPQTPAFAEATIGPLLGLVAGVGGEVRLAADTRSQPAERGTPEDRQRREEAERLRQDRWQRERQAGRLHVTAGRVLLPFARATVKVASRAVVPVSADRFGAQARDLAAALAFRQAAESPCAQAYAARLADEAAAIAGEPPCATSPAGSPACLRAFDAGFRRAWAASIDTCRERDAGLQADARREPVAADLQAMRGVDSRFRDFVAASRAERIDFQVTFRNRPPAHVGFGVGTAVVLGGRLDRPRVRLDRGVLVADPLGRQLTMGLLTWSPRGYDADAYRPSMAERIRPFASVIITPDFGVGAGVSILAVRGVSVNAGAGLLFTRTAAPGDAIGAPPADAADPFALGVARVAFVGVSFNLR